MTNTYFLGANSGRGFASLYSGFAPGAYLHVIKGGAGTGKSGFMRSIGREAERRGLDAEYVLCSGDPDSLDAVYIPALGQAWTDGTAPHISDPPLFGASGDYVNLGQFCRLPLSSSDAALASELSTQYRELFRRAYAYLGAAMELAGAKPQISDAELAARIEKRALGIAERKMKQRGAVHRRYLSAISCKGVTELYSALCKPVYLVDNERGEGEMLLEALVRAGELRGAEMTVCPSPLDPERVEGVVLPEAVYVTGLELPEARRVHLGVKSTPELRGIEREKKRMTAQAVELLRAEKAAHDALEAVYRPYMDFFALTAFTGREIEQLFGA